METGSAISERPSMSPAQIIAAQVNHLGGV
jgi:hypothetical protein